MDHFKNACRLHLDGVIHRYLQCNAQGSLDGHGKAQSHRELCTFYVGVKYGVLEDVAWRLHWEEIYALHDATDTLTSYMDREIGFPITGHPDYDKLAPLFFERFHGIAVEFLGLQKEAK